MGSITWAFPNNQQHNIGISVNSTNFYQTSDIPQQDCSFESLKIRSLLQFFLKKNNTL